MTQVIEREFYVYDESLHYNMHDAGYSSLLYNKKTFIELII
jgi:hypothetical protein